MVGAGFAPTTRRGLACVLIVLGALGAGCGRPGGPPLASSNDPSAGSPDGGGTSTPCSPKTCAALGAECGFASDGCGGSLTCGTCAPPEVCGENGTPNVCACVPRACAPAGVNCGDLDDGCGGAIACGDCAAPATCGGGGLANVCGTPRPYALPFCSFDGWCWENPLPQGDPLLATRVLSATDVWAVGSAGAALHWDGTQWRQVVTGTSAGLTGIYASAAEDVWIACDDGALLHGGTTTPLQSVHPTPSGVALNAVWGSGASDVWAVGAQATILHYDGHGWSTVTTGNPATLYTGVWGSSASDVWVVGNFLTNMPHWDGHAWSTVSTGIEGYFTTMYSVGGTGPNDIWVGGMGTLLHYDGSAWAFAYTGDANATYITGVAALAPNDAWFTARDFGQRGLFHWNGTSFETFKTQFMMNAVHGLSPTAAWAVGKAGEIMHLEDGAFVSQTTRIPSDTPLTSDAWLTVAGKGGEVYVGGDRGTVAHSNGTTWWPTQTPFKSVAATWMAAPNDLFALGLQNPAGFGTLARFDGTSWTPHSTPTTMGSVFGARADDVWFGQSLPNAPAFVHFDGQNFKTRIDENQFTPGPITGSHAGDLWATGGYGGAFIHYDGTGWTLASPKTNVTFTSLSSTSPTDVWGVGGDLEGTSKIGHWDGASWVVSTLDGRLQAISAYRPNDVYAVGDSGRIAHYDGSWHTMSSGVAIPLSAVYAGERGTWVVGDQGAILHRAPLPERR